MNYYCTNCGGEFPKWSGKCSACGQWDSLAEALDQKVGSKTSKGSGKKRGAPNVISISNLSKKKQTTMTRISSGFVEFDRVMGGGMVPGSITLVAGEPGIGKSTILLQIALKVSADNKVLYISGEESISQIYSRISRVGNNSTYSENLLLSDETSLEGIAELISSQEPSFVIVDSIQSLESEVVRSSAGSIGQVRVCGALLTRLAKSTGVPIVVVGQINKEGSIAGPKVLEHVVDTVLHFEGGEFNSFRVLRSIKNRFGSTNEIGVFEMNETGLSEVANSSKLFLEGEGGMSGSAIGAVMQGSRVVFVEVQALVNERGMESGPLRRVANGIKKPRLDMLCAVLTKRGKVFLGDKDVFVNIVGGINIDNPTIDLAVCAAIKSAVNEKVLKNDTVYWGEVGLTGEVRGGFAAEMVLKESKRLGYSLVVLPKVSKLKTSLETKLLRDISSL
ncbi:DNA repair protein RadA [Candidatus Dojkabacteria bacterium]|nr:DNA repair protein RadA [Candidatus Dojkabacteria bacterium]